MERCYLSWWVWTLYLILLLAGIPWYWRWLAADTLILWFGFPAWVTTSLAASLLASLLTAGLLFRPWSFEPPANRSSRRPTAVAEVPPTAPNSEEH